MHSTTVQVRGRRVLGLHLRWVCTAPPTPLSRKHLRRWLHHHIFVMKGCIHVYTRIHRALRSPSFYGATPYVSFVEYVCYWLHLCSVLQRTHAVRWDKGGAGTGPASAWANYVSIFPPHHQGAAPAGKGEQDVDEARQCGLVEGAAGRHRRARRSRAREPRRRKTAVYTVCVHSVTKHVMRSTGSIKRSCAQRLRGRSARSPQHVRDC